MNIKIPFELRDLGEEYYQEHYSNSEYEVNKRKLKEKYKKTQLFLKKWFKLIICLMIVGAVIAITGSILISINVYFPFRLPITIIGYVIFTSPFTVFLVSIIRMYILSSMYNK